MLFVIWLLAILIGIYGVVNIVQGNALLGFILLIIAFLIGPGGYSIFK